MKGFTLIEVIITLMVVGILLAIFLPAIQNKETEPVIQEPVIIQDSDHGRILNPDGTPVRPSNDQIGHYTHYTAERPSVKDFVGEQCIDGILYLFITKNGKDFMAPKEDTFGYNEKCSE